MNSEGRPPPPRPASPNESPAAFGQADEYYQVGHSPLITVESTVFRLFHNYTAEIKPESDEEITQRWSQTSRWQIEKVHLMALILRTVRHLLGGCRGNNPQGRRRSEV